MNNNTIIEVLNKLVGYTTPYGSTEVDDARFTNLKTLCYITEYMLDQIKDVSTYKNRYEYSMKTMGEYADKFLKNLEYE